MYHHIRGTLVSKRPGEVVLEAGGVGYILRTPLSTYDQLPREGSSAKLLTYLHVTDDALTLFGFSTEGERRFFLQLVNHVKGVGPKMALAVLSGGRIEHIQQAIRLGDFKALKTIKGVGEATAKRIVLELGKILIKEVPEDGTPKAGVARKTAIQSKLKPTEQLSKIDELCDLAANALVQLNEVPREIALSAVQRAWDELSPSPDEPPAVQDLIRAAIPYAN